MRNVSDFVSVGAKVSVRIISIELEKNKFALSLLTAEEEAAQAAGDKGRRSNDAPRRASRNGANFTRGKREGEEGKEAPTRGKVATRGASWSTPPVGGCLLHPCATLPSPHRARL